MLIALVKFACRNKDHQLFLSRHVEPSMLFCNRGTNFHDLILTDKTFALLPRTSVMSQQQML